MSGREQESEAAYQAWRVALRRRNEADQTTVEGASAVLIDEEQKAWDKHRDLCEEANPHGDCSHPECPA